MINEKFLGPAPSSLGPAMQFVLDLAVQRARKRATPTSREDETRIAQLWDLAERYHPEEAWLAESYLHGERSADELRITAPRGALAPTLLASLGTKLGVMSHRATSAGPRVPSPVAQQSVRHVRSDGVPTSEAGC